MLSSPQRRWVLYNVATSTYSRKLFHLKSFGWVFETTKEKEAELTTSPTQKGVAQTYLDETIQSCSEKPSDVTKASAYQKTVMYGSVLWTTTAKDQRRLYQQT